MLVPALVLGATVVLVILSSTQAIAGPYGQPVAQDSTGELVAGRRAGQSFKADQAGLYRIDVYLGNYRRSNSGPLVLHVKAAPFLNPDLAVASVDAAQVRADGFVSFEFAPLPEPAGLPLCFWLEAPLAQPGNAVTVMGAAQDLYPDGMALFDEPPATGGVQDLAFRLYYRPGASQVLAALMERLTKGRPSIFGAPQLYQAVLAFYLIGLAGLLALVVARLRL